MKYTTYLHRCCPVVTASKVLIQLLGAINVFVGPSYAAYRAFYYDKNAEMKTLAIS